MARKDALIRLFETLKFQREELRKKLSREEVHSSDSAHGDSADLAIYDTEQELHTQLIAFESRELSRIEKAIQAIKDGVYGNCEYCGNKIPVTRLNALPHSSSCVICQQLHEDNELNMHNEADWENACEYQSREEDRGLADGEVKMPRR